MIPVFVITQESTNCYVCGSQTIAIIQLTQLYIYFEVDNGIPGDSTFPLHMVPCPQTMSPKAMSCFCCLRDSGPIFSPSWMCIDAHSTLSSSREFHTPSLLNFKCFQLVFKIQRSLMQNLLWFWYNKFFFSFFWYLYQVFRVYQVTSPPCWYLFFPFSLLKMSPPSQPVLCILLHYSFLTVLVTC